MKACFKCKEKKPLKDFYKHPQMADGHLNKCKTCARIDTKTNVAKNPEHYREYYRRRAMTPKAVAQRRKYAKEHPDVIKAIKKRWVINNPVKISAIKKRLNASRHNNEHKKQPCQVCGTTKWIHGHHPDYSKPLEVIWLCAKHHKEEHARLKSLL